MSSTNANANAYPASAIAPALKEQTLMDLYIPRIGASYVEADVRFIFEQANLAYVEYVDFVKVKSFAPDAPVKYCAFVKIGHWYTDIAHKELAEKGSHKFYLAHLGRTQIPRDCEHWLLLPNKTPLARTKVNIHQLATYTDELFEKMEDQTQEMEKQKECIYEQGLQLQQQKALIDEQTVQIKHLFNLCSFQNAQICQLHHAFQRALNEDDDDGEDMSLEPAVTAADAEHIVIRSATSSPSAAMETVDLLDWDTVEHCVEPVKYSHRLEELTMDNIQLPSSPPRLVRSNTVFLSNSSLDEMEETLDDEGPLTLDMLATPPRFERSDTVVMPTNSLEEEDNDAVMVDTQSTPPPLTRNNCDPEYQDYCATASSDMNVEENELPPPTALFRQASVSHRRTSPTEARVKYSDEICYNK
jgi:hypothetical protein